jgi:hypothetical protein
MTAACLLYCERLFGYFNVRPVSDLDRFAPGLDGGQNIQGKEFGSGNLPVIECNILVFTD